MSFSSGTYSAPASTWNPAVAGTAISTTDWAALLTDLSTALSTCVLKDGSQTITANIPMAGFKLTGLGAGSASGNSLRYEQVNGVVTTAGDMLYATAAGTLARLAIGTARKQLATNAGATAAEWVESLQSLMTAQGDIVQASAANTPARLALGAAGTIPMAGATAIAYRAALNKAIYGLTYANNAGDATNDLDIAAGGCMDATGAYWITVAALTKQSDVAWAVGSAAGGLDTGAVGNSDYYIWAIARSDTGVTDILFSLSSTAPTMPTNYDFKRLIGWFKRTGGTIVAFHTYETEGGGLQMKWDAPTLDIALTNTLTTTRRTDAVKVPLNFSVLATLVVVFGDSTTNALCWIGDPAEADGAVGSTAVPLGNAAHSAPIQSQSQVEVRTSAAGLVAARSNLATMDAYYASTIGFKWARRN